MTRYGSKELAASFRTVRNNTLQTARDIPADKYGYSPAPGTRTVEKLLTHIALVHRFQHQVHGVEKRTSMEGFDFPALMQRLGSEEAVSRTKDEVVRMLETEGETWATFLDGLTDDYLDEFVPFPAEWGQAGKTRFEMIMSVKEHEMHHRGQLMLVQRMLGIVPHLTRQREERMAQSRES